MISDEPDQRKNTCVNRGMLDGAKLDIMHGLNQRKRRLIYLDSGRFEWRSQRVPLYTFGFHCHPE